LENGAIAQLGERFNGIEEVVGSIPSGSTILTHKFIGLVDRHDAGVPSDSSLSGSLIYQGGTDAHGGQSDEALAETWHHKRSIDLEAVVMPTASMLQ
jgi:hypothetical protein